MKWHHEGYVDGTSMVYEKGRNTDFEERVKKGLQKETKIKSFWFTHDTLIPASCARQIQKVFPQTISVEKPGNHFNGASDFESFFNF
jgi:hypothetical protein